MGDFQTLINPIQEQTSLKQVMWCSLTEGIGSTNIMNFDV